MTIQFHSMKTTNNIPQGYKNSPLGIIPQEWEVKKLGDVAESFSGGTPKAGNNEYYDGNYNPQNEMFRLLGTKRSFSQNETFFFSHPYPALFRLISHF